MNATIKSAKANDPFCRLYFGLILTICGIIIPQLVAWLDDSYLISPRFISELGAEGYKYAALINFGSFLPAGIAIIGLCYCIFRWVPKNKDIPMQIWLISAPGWSYAGSAFFPCLPGCSLFSLADTQLIHNILGVVQYAGGSAGLYLWLRYFKAQHNKKWSKITSLVLWVFAAASLLMIWPELNSVRGLLQRMADYVFFGWMLMMTTPFARYRLNV